MSGPDVVNVKEAARRLGVHPDTLDRHLRDGTVPLPVIRIGRVRRIGVRALEQFINDGGTAQ